jgi:DNA (cytosine-5)-methyltransferase 1
MYQDNLFNELIIDNFAGGGGASVGIELATGRPVDIAINHDADAIAMHSVNHPYTQHFQEDVFAINPEEVTGGRPVGIAWFSPDCKHFSRAKGNKPVEHKIRGLSWVIIKWAMSSVAPRCIFMENVEEIQTWGPLIYVEGKEISETERMTGSFRPDPERSGETFKAFVGMLSDGVAPDCPALAEACEFLKIERGSADEQRLIKGLGYKLEFRTIRACDLGAPTIRKRFYLVARNDGKPIVFPKATHGKGKGLKPYRTAAECIDWSIPCPSIFERKKPLVKNTLRRVARGLDKFVIKNPKPYILEMNFDNPFQDVDRPMSTQTNANHHYLITPELVECSHKSGPGVHGVDAPMNTQTGKACFAVKAPYLTKFQQHSLGQDAKKPLDTVMPGATRFGAVMPSIIQYHSEQSKGEVRGQDIKEPLMTVDGSPRYAVNGIYISKYFGGEGAKASGASDPVPTVTARDHNSLVASNLCVLRKNMDGKSLDEPMPTLTTSAGHFAEIRTYLLPIDNSQELYHWNEVRELLNEYADYSIKENEILIIEIAGIPYFIGDIGMRMLKAEELKLAQGFPVDYIIDIERHIGKKYSEAKQIARLGNAVCPPVATALIRANCPELCYPTTLITIVDLEKAYSRSCK